MRPSISFRIVWWRVASLPLPFATSPSLLPLPELPYRIDRLIGILFPQQSGRQLGHHLGEARCNRIAPAMAAALDLLRPTDPDAVDADATGEDEMVEHLFRRQILR